MRTTIDLPDDLHRLARAIARDEGRSMSEIVVRLIRSGLGEGARSLSRIDDETGLPVIRLGRMITSEDVRDADADA